MIPPTGIRRCRPLMSSGTRAVSVVLVGITHHGWQDRELQKSSAVVPSEAAESVDKRRFAVESPSSMRQDDCAQAPSRLARCAKVERVESTEAILLRKRKFSDTSLIVSWCTESFGCVQTIAKGARRPKSPFAGKLDLFFEAEISIVRSRKSDLHTLAEVVLKNPFAGIRSNYLRTQTAAYFVELIEICTERDHREPELFGLLRRAFGYLDANDPTARAVAHFETELARIAGVHDRNEGRVSVPREAVSFPYSAASALGEFVRATAPFPHAALENTRDGGEKNVPMNCVWLAPKAQHSDEAWGNAPGIRTSRRTSALTARFTVRSEWRFQRLNVRTIGSWGVAPG